MYIYNAVATNISFMIPSHHATATQTIDLSRMVAVLLLLLLLLSVGMASSNAGSTLIAAGRRPDEDATMVVVDDDDDDGGPCLPDSIIVFAFVLAIAFVPSLDFC